MLRRCRRHSGEYPIVTGDVPRAVVRRFPYSVFFRTRADTLAVLAAFTDGAIQKSGGERD